MLLGTAVVGVVMMVYSTLGRGVGSSGKRSVLITGRRGGGVVGCRVPVMVGWEEGYR